MRFLPLFFCLSLYACQDPAPSPESPVAESDATSPSPDLLQPDDPSGIALQAIVFADSAQLAPQMSSSPQASYFVSSFAPHSTDESLNSVVNTTLANLIAGEEAPIRTKDLRKVIVTSVKTRLLNYKKQAVDTTEIAEMPDAWALEIRYTTEVLHNANGLLSLATQYYAYTGGAHGNYETVLHNFDVSKGKQLTYESLFSPDNNDQLLQLLKSAASEYENIHPTKNIALTKEGILFDYPPYEIASYAEGEIEVILPYKEVEPLLTETGKAIAKRMVARPLGREG